MGVGAPCSGTAPSHHCSRGDLSGRMGQSTSYSVCKPSEDLQETLNLCQGQQTLYYKVLSWTFVTDQILILHQNHKIRSSQILQMWFYGFFFSTFCLSKLKWTYDGSYRPVVIVSGRTRTTSVLLKRVLPHCISLSLVSLKTWYCFFLRTCKSGW